MLGLALALSLCQHYQIWRDHLLHASNEAIKNGKKNGCAMGSFRLWNFCILNPFENNFYKKTYVKTFSENRPFLGVLEHDAEVWGSASTDTTPRYCHVTDDRGRRRHGGAWVPDVGVVSSNSKSPTSARLDGAPSYWHHPARGPDGPTTLRGPIARRGVT